MSASGSKGDFAQKQRKLKQLSSQRPGVLLSRGFSLMHEQLGTIFDGATHTSEDSSNLTPVATRYLLSVVVPQLGEREIGYDRLRELRTLAHSLDLIVQGRAAQSGDVLVQRFKPILMSLRDKSDLASRWIELISQEVFPGQLVVMKLLLRVPLRSRMQSQKNF